MGEDQPTLGGEISRIRRKRGMSIRNVADDSRDDNENMRLTHGGLSRLERGDSDQTRLSTLLVLAEILNIKFTIDPDGVLVEELED